MNLFITNIGLTVLKPKTIGILNLLFQSEGRTVFFLRAQEGEGRINHRYLDLIKIDKFLQDSFFNFSENISCTLDD